MSSNSIGNAIKHQVVHAQVFAANTTYAKMPWFPIIYRGPVAVQVLRKNIWGRGLAPHHLGGNNG